MIETGILPQANGSCRVKVGGTDVLVGVKVEVGEPTSQAPDEGFVQATVECFGASNGDQTRAEAANFEFATMLERSIAESSSIDWTKLCHAKGRSCWVVYVDVVVMASAGAILDAASVASVAALHNTRVPNVAVSETEEGDIDLEVSDDPMDFFRLDTSGVPLCLSLSKIGSRYVVDPAMEEEACITSRLTVAVDTKASKICGMRNSGEGAMEPAIFHEILPVAMETAQQLRHKLDGYLAKEDPDIDLASSAPTIGYFGR